MKPTLLLYFVIPFTPISGYAAQGQPHPPQTTVGFLAQYAPDYMGASESSLSLLPSIEWQHGAWFAGTGSGIGYSFTVNDYLYID